MAWDNPRNSAEGIEEGMMGLDVRPVIETAVRAALPTVPVDKIEIEFRHDQNDEEAWFVAIEVPPETKRLGGEKLLSAMVSVNNALLAAEESRFAYVLIRYLGEEDADEGEPIRASDS